MSVAAKNSPAKAIAEITIRFIVLAPLSENETLKAPLDTVLTARWERIV
jgi:hypothetical protein